MDAAFKQGLEDQRVPDITVASVERKAINTRRLARSHESMYWEVLGTKTSHP